MKFWWPLNFTSCKRSLEENVILLKHEKVDPSSDGLIFKPRFLILSGFSYSLVSNARSCHDLVFKARFDTGTPVFQPNEALAPVEGTNKNALMLAYFDVTSLLKL